MLHVINDFNRSVGGWIYVATKQKKNAGERRKRSSATAGPRNRGYCLEAKIYCHIRPSVFNGIAPLIVPLTLLEKRFDITFTEYFSIDSLKFPSVDEISNEFVRFANSSRRSHFDRLGTMVRVARLESLYIRKRKVFKNILCWEKNLWGRTWA